ncbi:ATP-binding cassette subfamily B protein [Micromonospora sp. Llam0]|uniref:ABC transporter ATP-binding protein n=1 Tax=Micromonospora sp. Llam0 TaxID=2485143 RepID=UPI000F49853A|nr:ABC transporter ATP-binding protein [Micromonospora sp. Llam0]ROO60504.1 ATP-binding cassette subfamily B protein [Micromonospora sp. Llam0]
MSAQAGSVGASANVGPGADAGGAGAVSLWRGVGLMLGFARPGRRRLAGAVALTVVATAGEVAVYLVLAHVGGLLLGGAATGADIVRWTALALVISVARSALWAWGLAVSHDVAFDVLSVRLRGRLVDRLHQVPLGRVTGPRAGQMRALLTDDVEELEVFVAHGVPETVSAAVVWVAVTVWLVTVDPLLALAAVAVVMLAFVALTRALRGADVMQARTHAAWSAWSGAVLEVLRGLPVLHLLPGAASRGPVGRSCDCAEAYAAGERDWAAAFLPAGTAFAVLLAAPLAVLLPLGLWRLDAGAVTPAQLIVVLVVGGGYSAPLLRFYHHSMRLALLTSAANGLQELLDVPSLPPPRPTTIVGAGEGTAADTSGGVGRGLLELRDVTFSYPGTSRPAVDDVTLTCAPGSLTALVGASGAGKTTLVRLVGRFFDPQAGAVLVDGVDVRDLPAHRLRQLVTFVFQDVFLFDDTVAANLRVGRPDATVDQMWDALRAARLDEVVARLPDGLDTPLGQRGSRLSAGERQRMAIARAVLHDAPVVILDEATAHVDPDNATLVQDALTNLAVGRTLLVVAHRLKTVAGADTIAVLDGGRLVEQGRHADLVAAGGRYARLWQS